MTKAKTKAKTKAVTYPAVTPEAVDRIRTKVSNLDGEALPSRVRHLEKLVKPDHMKAMEERAKDLAHRIRVYIDREAVVTEVSRHIKSTRRGEDISQILSIIIASLDAPNKWWAMHETKHYKIATWARVFAEVEAKGTARTLWFEQ